MSETYDASKPLKLRVEITLSETQMHVLTEQAKFEHRSIDQMIQLMLYEGWVCHTCDNVTYVRRREAGPDNSKLYDDDETAEMMKPLIPESL
jgi:hypothetical protein